MLEVPQRGGEAEDLRGKRERDVTTYSSLCKSDISHDTTIASVSATSRVVRKRVWTFVLSYAGDADTGRSLEEQPHYKYRHGPHAMLQTAMQNAVRFDGL